MYIDNDKFSFRYSKSEYFVVCCLLFLLPIGTVSVEHWISGIFTLLALVALVGLPKNIIPLSANEKWVLFGMLLMYLSYIQATALYGWNKDIGVQLRFLMFVPIYMLLKRHPFAGLWLLRGTIFALFPIFLQSLYDVEVLELSRSNGFYGPLFIGSIASVFSLIALASLMSRDCSRMERIAIYLLVIGGVYSVIVSVSRASILMLLFGAMGLFLASKLQSRVKWFFLISGLVGAIVAYNVSDRIRYEVQRPLMDLKTYMEIEEPAAFRGSLYSAGERMTFWKTAALIIREYPIFGVGMFGYREIARVYKKNGLVNKTATYAAHPHNMFLEMWVSRGVLGICALFIVLVSLYKAYFGNYKTNKTVATVGLIHLTGVIFFGLFESAPVLKGNYAAFFLVYSAALLSLSQVETKTIWLFDQKKGIS